MLIYFSEHTCEDISCDDNSIRRSYIEANLYTIEIKLALTGTRLLSIKMLIAIPKVTTKKITKKYTFKEIRREPK